MVIFYFKMDCFVNFSQYRTATATFSLYHKPQLCRGRSSQRKMLQYTLHYNLLQSHSIIYNQYTIIPQAGRISCLCPIIFSVMVPLDLWLGCEERRASENVKGDRLAFTASTVAPRWRQEVVDYVGVV